MAILPGPAHRKRRSSISSHAEKARRAGVLRPRRLVLILFAVSLFALFHLFSQASSRESQQLRLAAEKQRARLPQLMDTPLPPGTIFTTPSSDKNMVPDLPFVRLGSKLTDLVAPGWSKDDTYAAGTYNPAMLRLPKGVEWQYIVVARAPGVYHHDQFIAMANSHAYEQALVGFGVNRTQDGRFVAVSYETKLAIDAPSGSKCGNWAHYYGAEDPRLLWSDDFRPVVSFGLPATDLLPKSCRSLAYSRDLRTLWPELDVVLKGAAGVAPTLIGSARSTIFEITATRAQWIEKNWQMLWPGARPSLVPGAIPSFSYTPSPSVILEPSKDNVENAIVTDRKKELELRTYTEVTPGPHASCLSRFHHASEPKAIHHATPLYRLTLCDRGTCQPDVTNTVFITLMHLKKAGFSTKQNYGRFFSLQNVTSPYDYVAVGPEFHFDGTDDSKIVYGLSMTFEPRAPEPAAEGASANQAPPRYGGFRGRPSLSPYLSSPSSHAIDAEKQAAKLGLSHGFLSDDVWISLGVADIGMSMIRLTPDEILKGMRRCDGPAPASSAEGGMGGAVAKPAVVDEHAQSPPPPSPPAKDKEDIVVDMDADEKAALALAKAQADKAQNGGQGRLAAPDFVPPRIGTEDPREGP